jgi:hypothetical protein
MRFLIAVVLGFVIVLLGVLADPDPKSELRSYYVGFGAGTIAAGLGLFFAEAAQ